MPSPRRLAVLLVLLATRAALAADPAGTVAALQGRADAQRGGAGAWAALAVQQSVFVGDRLRTAEQSRLKLLMRDDAVITLGAKSELVIDEQVVRTERSTSTLGLAVGTVRAVVTDRYGAKGSHFNVKTPTAVAGVRGTGFLALVDEDAKRTRVVGLYHVTAVRSVLDSQGKHEVRVGPGQMTEILAGELPTKPRELAKSELDALSALTEVVPAVGGTEPTPGTPGGEDGDVPSEGSGDPGDPATPGPPGGGSIQPPGGVIDQPLDRLRAPREPSPPPPNRR